MKIDCKNSKSLRASGRCPEPHSLRQRDQVSLFVSSTPLAGAHPPLQPRHRLTPLCLFSPWRKKFLLTTDYCQQDKKTFTISWVELYIDLTQLQMDWVVERIFHWSKNIFAMDLAKILHAEDRFFCSAQKFFCNNTMFGNKTLLVVRCLIAVKQQYLNIKIALFSQ